MAAQQDPHALAVDAQSAVHELAVVLQAAGVDPRAVQQLTEFAKALAELAKQLNQAPLPQQAPRSISDAAGQTQQMMVQSAQQRMMGQ